jgi:hypothetical protein
VLAPQDHSVYSSTAKILLEKWLTFCVVPIT